VKALIVSPDLRGHDFGCGKQMGVDKANSLPEYPMVLDQLQQLMIAGNLASRQAPEH
jgi:hypothetical protein